MFISVMPVINNKPYMLGCCQLKPMATRPNRLLFRGCLIPLFNAIGRSAFFFSSVAADLALRLGPDSERSGRKVCKKYETLWFTNEANQQSGGQRCVCCSPTVAAWLQHGVSHLRAADWSSHFLARLSLNMRSCSGGPATRYNCLTVSWTSGKCEKMSNHLFNATSNFAS